MIRAPAPIAARRAAALAAVMSTLSTPTSSFAHSADGHDPSGHRNLLISPLLEKVLAPREEFQRFGRSRTPDGLRDYVVSIEDDPHDAREVFATLRWGGQFVYASASRSRVRLIAEQFRGGGFDVQQEPAYVRRPFPWLPFLGRKVHYFIARKTQLIRPGEITDRFTYQVELERSAHSAEGNGSGSGEEMVVCKRVPTVESVVNRLRSRWPDASTELIERRARKFTDKIFPTFLTREAAILKILQEHLPQRYASRVPHALSIEKDERGFVTTLRMNWLRNGGAPLSQLEFALQSADLLRAIHDSAHVIHLDLRLDNMVITPGGVGFVDFGSSVRIAEDLDQNPLLGTLFEELMRTSHIQKMLYKMTRSGEVTASHFCTQHGRVDKAIDLFYLALQFTTPHANPDLAGLIQYDPQSEVARELAELSTTILRPHDPHDTSHRSAKDILRSLEMIERVQKRGSRRAAS